MSWVKADWNSLDVAKLAVPALSSLILAPVGYLISAQLSQIKDQNDRISQNYGELVKKRIDLYDAIARKSNRVFAYYLYIGKWKEETPETIISYKRELDELIYSYQPIFTAEAVNSYNKLTDQFFKTYGSWGEDARLRTTTAEREKFSRSRKEEYKDRFTNEDNRKEICDAYNEFINKLSAELQMKLLTGEQTIITSCPKMQLIGQTG